MGSNAPDSSHCPHVIPGSVFFVTPRLVVMCLKKVNEKSCYVENRTTSGGLWWVDDEPLNSHQQL